MSDSEIMAVVRLVANIVGTYKESKSIVKSIKERAKSRRPNRNHDVLDRASRDLEYSLSRGQEMVRSQYERDFRRLGQTFAVGDGEH